MFAIGYVDGTSVPPARAARRGGPPGPRFSNVCGRTSRTVDDVDDRPASRWWAGRRMPRRRRGPASTRCTCGRIPRRRRADLSRRDETPVVRPDLAAAFGAQFTNAGFAFQRPACRWARTRSCLRAQRERRRVPVGRRDVGDGGVAAGHASDLPASGATVRSGFAVGGWAIDLSADAGQNGIDVMHVWAYPPAGRARIPRRGAGRSPTRRRRGDLRTAVRERRLPAETAVR